MGGPGPGSRLWHERDFREQRQNQRLDAIRLIDFGVIRGTGPYWLTGYPETENPEDPKGDDGGGSSTGD